MKSDDRESDKNIFPRLCQTIMIYYDIWVKGTNKR